MLGMDEKVTRLVEWMRQQAQQAGARGGVFGVSGGVDSALVLALSVRAWPGNCLGLVMPCHSEPKDAEDAIELLNLFRCPYELVDLAPVYDVFLSKLPALESSSLALARANLKVRLRMVTWYYFANLKGYLVVGTGNRDEVYVGYSTKYGDSAADIMPLAGLTKGEVREMARYLGVPDRIVEKPPTAGLWKGQTDEGEMGLLYRDIDAYLLGRQVPPEVAKRIEERHRASEHKRRMPPFPVLG